MMHYFKSCDLLIKKINFNFTVFTLKAEILWEEESSLNWDGRRSQKEFNFLNRCKLFAWGGYEHTAAGRLLLWNSWWFNFHSSLSCCSSASALCDRWQHHPRLHESFLQPELTVRCKSLFKITSQVIRSCSVSVRPSMTDGSLCFFKVKQYIVILSWQFDKHVKESKNFTVREGILKGTAWWRCVFIQILVHFQFQVTQWHWLSSQSFPVCFLCPAANLTAGTMYEVAVWAHTSIGDSPTALSHHQTAGTQPERPYLKTRALNQTAVDCTWTLKGPPAQVQHSP